MLTEDAITANLRRVLDAFESAGFPRAVVEQWSIPAADAVDLIRAFEDARPQRILEVGTFVGTSALLMLLCFPDSQVHSIDPNFPLEVEFDAMKCAERNADLSRRTQSIAAAAAEVLGVRARLLLHEGGFSTEATFAGRTATTPSIGATVIAQHGPFDAAFIDGLHFEHAVLSDLRLAVSGMSAHAPIVLHDCVGYWGSTVRRAVTRFMEETPNMAFTHPPFRELYRSVGVLSSSSRETDSSFASRMRTAFESREHRLPELIARAVAAQLPPVCARAADEASGEFATAIGVRAECPVLVVAMDSLDRVEQDALAATISALAHGADGLLLGLTPPGEALAASAWSRPLATTVAALESEGFDAYDAIIPFLEPFTYALGSGCVLAVQNSFLATSLIALRRGSALAAAADANGLDRVSVADARRIQSARTQRVHDLSSLARFRTEHAQLTTERESLRQQSANGSSNATQVAQLQAELASVNARLKHMLAWRIHIGRHHMWRRTVNAP